MTADAIYKGELRTKLRHLRSNTTFVTDAPVDNNGKGESFSPTDLLAASLLSCMITIMGIAIQKNKMPTISMRGNVNKIMFEHPRRVGHLEVEIEIGGASALSNEQKKMLEIAAHNCPVAKSLHPDILQDVKFIYVG